jgi:hypothetical protein
MVSLSNHDRAIPMADLLYAEVRETKIRLEEEGRVGALNFEPQIDIADIGDEGRGADRVAEHD